MHSNISKYVDLIESFLTERIGAKQFEQAFLQLFKSDDASVQYPKQIFDALDSLFAAVDEYCDDSELRKQLPRSVDERGLLDAAHAAHDRLITLLGDEIAKKKGRE